MPLVLTANTAPVPLVPPSYDAPYRVLPDKTKVPSEPPASLLVLNPRLFGRFGGEIIHDSKARAVGVDGE